jgi:hypothetical protein
MRLIPTHCERCSRSALIGADAIVNGETTCADCGGRARSLPGESYADEDVALFKELDAALRDAGISASNAAQLAAELEVRSFGVPGRGLKRLAQVLPSLGILELIVTNQPAIMRKAEGMLATLFDAISSDHRPSGMIPAVTELQHPRSGGGSG